MTISTGTVLRVVAQMLWTDANINQNIFNALVSGGGGPWDEQDIVDDAEAWLANMYANIVGAMSDEIDGNEVIVYEYDPGDTDWDEVGSQAWVLNFTKVDEQLPRGVAALVRLWTTDPDVQGKKYIPALTEGDLVDGLFQGALITNLLAFAADWYNPFTGSVSGATWTPGIWSVKNSAFVQAVDHIATSTIPAYQRRRKRNVGI